MWVIFLALHLIGLVAYSLLLRKSLVDKVDPWSLATIMQTALAMPMVFALFVSPPELASYDARTTLQIMVTIVLVICLHLANVNALKNLEASVYSVLFNLRIIFSTILGILFLGESVVPLQIVGGLFIFAAVIAVRQKGKKEVTISGIKWGVAASVIISVLNLSEKDLLNNLSYLEYAIPVMLSAAILMWGILLARGQHIKTSIFLQPRMIQLMTFRAMSGYGLTLALYYGSLLSVTTYISSFSVILIVIFGALLLQENDYMKQKIIATVLALMGLTAILIANLG